LPHVRGPLEPVGIRDARHDLAAPSRRPHVDRALRATIREAERRAPRAVRPASDAAPVVANARAHGIEAPGRPAEQALRAAVAEAARARLRSRYPEDRDEDGDPRDQSRMYDPVRMHISSSTDTPKTSVVGFPTASRRTGRITPLSSRHS